MYAHSQEWSTEVDLACARGTCLALGVGKAEIQVDLLAQKRHDRGNLNLMILAICPLSAISPCRLCPRMEY